MSSIIIDRMPYSEIRKMLDAAVEMEKQGRKIVHMEIGRTDFDTPKIIKDAAKKALDEGKVHYGPTAGVMELREAVSERYEREYNLRYDPATEVVITTGASEGIYAAISALLNPGDQILIPDPVFQNYSVVPMSHFIEPISYPLRLENGFQPDIDELERLITPRTRMIALISPGNPTGVMYSRESLEKMAALAVKYDLYVLSDEIYSKIVYAPAEHVSIATMPGMRDRTLILDGMSKFYSMTGWRIGWLAGDKKLMNPILRMHQYMVSVCCTFAQIGSAAGLRGSQEEPLAMLAEYTRRRDFLCDELSRMPGIRFVKPDGALYVFVDISAFGMSGHDIARELLQQAGVVTVGGEAFGRCGKGFIRLAYSTSLEAIKTGCEAMHAYFSEKVRR